LDEICKGGMLGRWLYGIIKGTNKRGDKDKILNILRSIEIGISFEDIYVGRKKQYTLENLKEISLKYSSKIAWLKADNKTYSYAKRKGLLEILTSHMVPKYMKWKDKKEIVIESAKKYKKLAEWAKNDKKAYAAAERNGWAVEATAHMVNPRSYWKKIR
jgi:hypothetical protein